MDNMLYKKWFSTCSSVLLVTLIAGCAQQSAISIQQDKINTPTHWSSNSSHQNLIEENSQDKIEFSQQDWIQSVVSKELKNTILQALKNNYQIKQQELSVNAFEQNVIISGATLWPNLDLGFSSSRRKSADPTQYSSNSDLSLSLRYEFDIWGKLSANEQQVNLQLASQQAQLKQAKQELISNTIIAWFNVVESGQQLELNQQRLRNTKQNLAIIESGYESGLNSSLDVYLTRNEVANERARVANQQSKLSTALRQLELLIGIYPAGEIALEKQTLQVIDSHINAGVPSEVIANNANLQASWFNLLAKDAALAYAHKQRFPSLSLTANLGTSSNELSDLLSAGIGWSLLGNLTQPLFNAGKLAANEEKVRLETKQAEYAYLEKLNNTFAEAENRLTQEQNLKINVEANEQAVKNATLAQELSFEQYLKGLVSYTTVLDAQSRAFSAKSALIQAKYQLLENRLKLHLALGDQFNSIILNGSN